MHGNSLFYISSNAVNIYIGGLFLYLLQQDLFAFEILGGHLYLHADLGSGPVKVRSSKTRIDDGVWHDVALRRVERDGRVTVDGNTADFRTPGNVMFFC